MSISAIKKKWSLYWLGFALFCTVFALIYEHFSHGVISLYMILMPLIPTLGSIGCFFFRHPSRLFQDGVLALTLAFLLKGILEIYGTANILTDYFLYMAAALSGIGILLSVLGK